MINFMKKQVKLLIFTVLFWGYNIVESRGFIKGWVVGKLTDCENVFAWFDHQEESFSHWEAQFKKV